MASAGTVFFHESKYYSMKVCRASEAKGLAGVLLQRNEEVRKDTIDKNTPVTSVSQRKFAHTRSQIVQERKEWLF